MSFRLRVQKLRREIESVVPDDGVHRHSQGRERKGIAQGGHDRPRIPCDEILEIDFALRAV